MLLQVEALMQQPGSLLHEHAGSIVLVSERVPNDVSSSAVRRELAAGRSVRYLMDDDVIQYIRQRGLYQ